MKIINYFYKQSGRGSWGNWFYFNLFFFLVFPKLKRLRNADLDTGNDTQTGSLESIILYLEYVGFICRM